LVHARRKYERTERKMRERSLITRTKIPHSEILYIFFLFCMYVIVMGTTNIVIVVRDVGGEIKGRTQTEW
jgi:hypothetical protein